MAKGKHKSSIAKSRREEDEKNTQSCGRCTGDGAFAVWADSGDERVVRSREEADSGEGDSRLCERRKSACSHH